MLFFQLLWNFLDLIGLFENLNWLRLSHDKLDAIPRFSEFTTPFEPVLNDCQRD